MTLPPLYANYSMDFPGSPQAMSRGMAISNPQLHHHDIDAHQFLEEVEMGMYAEVFLANFSINNTSYLNRKKLQALRLQDLPKMGITQYSHQKIIHDHIQHVLEFEFASPVRKKQVRSKMEELFPDRDFGPQEDEVPKVKKLTMADMQIPERDMEKRSRAKHVNISKRRRRSFDKDAWQCISHLRTADATSHEVAEALREGNAQVAVKVEMQRHEQRRRRSFEGHNHATAFGNRALGADMINKELHALQNIHMKRLKRVMNCEEAHIMFIHERTHDLLLVTEHRVWYRLPLGFSVPGQCAESGATINVAKAYDDTFFNSNLDEKLGIKSRQVLCYPLRGNRGAGTIIGVLMCTNKEHGFDDNDENALADLASNMADDLHTKFRELTTIADIMYGSAVFVNGNNGTLGTRRGGATGAPSSLHHITIAMEAHKVQAYDAAAAPNGMHSQHESNKMRFA